MNTLKSAFLIILSIVALGVFTAQAVVFTEGQTNAFYTYTFEANTTLNAEGWSIAPGKEYSPGTGLTGFNISNYVGAAKSGTMNGAFTNYTVDARIRQGGTRVGWGAGVEGPTLDINKQIGASEQSRVVVQLYSSYPSVFGSIRITAYDSSGSPIGSTSGFPGLEYDVTALGGSLTNFNVTDFHVYRVMQLSTTQGRLYIDDNATPITFSMGVFSGAGPGRLILGGSSAPYLPDADEGTYEIDFLRINDGDAFDFRAIPEPSAAVLLGVGAILLALRRMKK